MKLSAACGENSFVEWIHQWLICGWCGPCWPLRCSDCVCSWQSYHSVAIETARAFGRGGIRDDKRNKYKLNRRESASYQLSPWDNKSGWNAGKWFEQLTYLYFSCQLHAVCVYSAHYQKGIYRIWTFTWKQWAVCIIYCTWKTLNGLVNWSFLPAIVPFCIAAQCCTCHSPFSWYPHTKSTFLVVHSYSITLIDWSWSHHQSVRNQWRSLDP